jgi:hypothetical protein
MGRGARQGRRRDQRHPRRGRADHPRGHHRAAPDRDGGGAGRHDAPFEGDTDIFIYPGYSWKVTDALMTNFHLPKSTLMMLVSALMGRERIMEIYAHAIAREYRFFSYGDASLAHSVAESDRRTLESPAPRQTAEPHQPAKEPREIDDALRASWALLLGMFLLQIGNGLQGSLMGVRGAIEGFSTFELSLIASAYFLGFLGGSRWRRNSSRRWAMCASSRRWAR